MAAKDTRINDATKEDFARVIGDKKGMTIGAMWKISEEMSEHRKEKQGEDRIKQAYYRNFEREHGVKAKAEILEEKRRAADEAMKRAEEKLKRFQG